MHIGVSSLKLRVVLCYLNTSLWFVKIPYCSSYLPALLVYFVYLVSKSCTVRGDQKTRNLPWLPSNSFDGKYPWAKKWLKLDISEGLRKIADNFTSIQYPRQSRSVIQVKLAVIVHAAQNNFADSIFSGIVFTSACWNKGWVCGPLGIYASSYTKQQSGSICLTDFFHVNCSVTKKSENWVLLNIFLDKFFQHICLLWYYKKYLISIILSRYESLCQ